MCSIWGACSLLHLWSIDKHVKSANNTLLPGRTGIRSPSKTALPRYSNRLPRPSRDSSSFDSTCLTACLNHSSLFPPPSPPFSFLPNYYQPFSLHSRFQLLFEHHLADLRAYNWNRSGIGSQESIYYSEIIERVKKKNKEMRETERKEGEEGEEGVWERCFVTIARILFQGLSLPILTG